MVAKLSNKLSRKLSLGPVLFNWQPEDWRDFYFRIADEAPIDSIYVGEAVCSKRQPFFEPFMPEVIERLTNAGKEVVYSTLALVMTKREAEIMADLAENADLMVEANDLSAVSHLNGKPHVVGPYISTYNEGTVNYFMERGASRIVLPAELPASALGVMADCGVEMEVQVFGRLPLAISARCYHARSRNLHKDSCQYVCGEDADGMDLETLDGDAFLSVNGTQTLSHSYYNLAAELAELTGLGVDIFRLNPHPIDMVAVAHCYRDLLDGSVDIDEANDQLTELTDGVPFANGFHHAQPGVAYTSGHIGAE